MYTLISVSSSAHLETTVNPRKPAGLGFKNPFLTLTVTDVAVCVACVVVATDIQLSALRSLLACVTLLAACHIDACLDWLQCYKGSFEPVTQRRLNAFYRIIATSN